MKHWITIGLLLTGNIYALSSVEEKERLIGMLGPIGDIIDRMGKHNIWHYKKTGHCDRFGLKGTLIRPAEEATKGQLSGNLVRYVFMDFDDCRMYIQFHGVPEPTPGADVNQLNRSYEYRLDNIMLVFTPVMEHTTGESIAFSKRIHGGESDLYTVADWSCEILHVIPKNLVDNHYDATRETSVAGRSEELIDQNVTQGTAGKPHPFAYIKTINGANVLVNFSHELPGKLLKKCRSFKTG